MLDREGVKHETHLFLEGESAPAKEVAEIIGKVAKQVTAAVIVASRSNKVLVLDLLIRSEVLFQKKHDLTVFRVCWQTWHEKWFLGSVAESLAKLPHPLILVTTQPL